MPEKTATTSALLIRADHADGKRAEARGELGVVTARSVDAPARDGVARLRPPSP